MLSNAGEQKNNKFDQNKKKVPGRVLYFWYFFWIEINEQSFSKKTFVWK